MKIWCRVSQNNFPFKIVHKGIQIGKLCYLSWTWILKTKTERYLSNIIATRSRRSILEPRSLIQNPRPDPNPYLVSLDKKIEQELWNQCYKNPISHLQEQQKSKSARPEIRQEAAHNLTELLEGAYGFYLRLLDEICEVYSLEVPNRASDKQLKMINTLVPNRGL